MLRRFILIAIVVTLGTAPLAHAVCQLTCVKPAASAAHDHCSPSASPGDSDRLISTAPDCADQIERDDVSASVAKIIAHMPMLAASTIEIAPPSLRRSTAVTFTPLISSAVHTRTQLRV